MSAASAKNLLILLFIIFTVFSMGSCSDDPAEPEPVPVPKGWVVMTSPLDSLTLNSVWGNAPDSVVAVGDSGTVLSYNGTAWTAASKLTTKNLNSVHGSAGDRIYAVGDDATVLYFNGTVWNLEPTSRAANMTGVFVGDNGSAAVCDAGGNLGSPHNSAPCGYAGPLFSVWANSDLFSDWDQYATSSDGFVLHYSGSLGVPFLCGGWKVGDHALRAIWGFSRENIVVVGDAGTIYRYDGTDWTAQTSGTAESLRGIWGKAPNSIFVVGDKGTIIHYNGTTWAAVRAGTTEDLYGIYGVSNNTIFAVGANGTILRRDL